ncbi:MAG TPA: N-acetylmuramidase domain-containing protein [Dehalococcoidia bacterium]|nr:N-acetylmuramidase domain-containing protein [Dehalococcoidia bacterium]
MSELNHDPAAGWQSPVPGAVITQLYGPGNTDPGVRHLYRKGYHTGIDFGGVSERTPVLSPSNGTVSLAATNAGYGECVIVERSDGVEVLFGHLCRIDVAVGQRIAAGQAVGGIGTTGVSTGVHLHLEYRRHGEDIDPAPFLHAGQAGQAAAVAEPPALPARVLVNANLRGRLGEDAAVLGVVPAGAAVALRHDAYYPVRWNGRDGWLWGTFLEFAAGDAASPGEQSPAAADVQTAERRGHTTAELNLRAGPGTIHPVLRTLPPGTSVGVLAERGEWLQVQACGTEGYVHRGFVAFGHEPLPEGFLRGRPDFANVPLAPAPSEHLVAPAMTDTERLVAETWNRYGGLLIALSKELCIDPATAVAVLTIEAGGRAFPADGRMIIRFENHIFHDEWGGHAPDAFARHFASGDEQPWQGHLWRPSPAEAWREFHGDQSAEWQVFEFACGLDDTAAKRAISMGAPQIMGFNHAAIGYASVQAMFDAFSCSAQAQLIGFFDFVRGASADSPRLLALQRQDFHAFAALYNGSGQAATYAGMMENVFNAFQRLR